MNMPNKNKRHALIKNEIQTLEDENGRLTAESVVRRASNLKNVMHDEFEWDDTKAAHAHRLEQARELIRSVKVVITIEKNTIAVPYYVRDPEVDASDQGYVALEKIQQEPENAAKELDYEFSRAIAFLTRAAEIAEALGMKSDVVAVTRKAQALRKRIEEAAKKMRGKE